MSLLNLRMFPGYLLVKVSEFIIRNIRLRSSNNYQNRPLCFLYRAKRYRVLVSHPIERCTLPHTRIIPYLFLLAGQATAMAQSPLKMIPTMLCLLCLPLVTFCATAEKKSSPGSNQDQVSSIYL